MSNCHDRCNLSRYCHEHGCDREDFPDECSMYYHIEDIIADAREYEREQRISLEELNEWE